MALDPFAALNVATGEVLARCKPRHRATDFVAFLREIEASVEPALEVHLALDNLSAHRAPVVHRWLLRHPLPSALYADVRVVAQSRGSILRNAHREGIAPTKTAEIALDEDTPRHGAPANE
jgi:hypothetical protein